MAKGKKRSRVVLSDEESDTAQPSKSGNAPHTGDSDLDSDVPLAKQKQPRLAEQDAATTKSECWLDSR